MLQSQEAKEESMEMEWMKRSLFFLASVPFYYLSSIIIASVDWTRGPFLPSTTLVASVPDLLLFLFLYKIFIFITKEMMMIK